MFYLGVEALVTVKMNKEKQLLQLLIVKMMMYKIDLMNSERK